jgi:hypothetical protein
LVYCRTHQCRRPATCRPAAFCCRRSGRSESSSGCHRRTGRSRRSPLPVRSSARGRWSPRSALGTQTGRRSDRRPGGPRRATTGSASRPAHASPRVRPAAPHRRSLHARGARPPERGRCAHVV